VSCGRVGTASVDPTPTQQYDTRPCNRYVDAWRVRHWHHLSTPPRNCPRASPGNPLVEGETRLTGGVGAEWRRRSLSAGSAVQRSLRATNESVVWAIGPISSRSCAPRPPGAWDRRTSPHDRVSRLWPSAYRPHRAALRPPGRYVYFTYACIVLNAVTERRVSCAVLIRALEPIAGVATMRSGAARAAVLRSRRLCERRVNRRLNASHCSGDCSARRGTAPKRVRLSPVSHRDTQRPTGRCLLRQGSPGSRASPQWRR